LYQQTAHTSISTIQILKIMKKHIISLAIIVLSALNLFGQNDKFNTALKAAVANFDTAKSPDQFIAVGNTFARIAAAEPKEWLPDYYAAYANLIAGFMTTGADMDKGQKYIDNAQTFITSAQKKATNPTQLSEIGVVQAYIYIGKVTEDPMKKGGELSPKIFAELGKASAMNPTNPRAPFVQGMFTLNMPEFYGGGVKNAMPLFEKAKALFDAQTTDGINPSWGKDQNEGLMQAKQ
jgi:hypothetical protein